MSLKSLLTQITNQVGSISGIRSARDLPPEEMPEAPFAVAYPVDGQSKDGTPGSKTELVSIAVEVMVPRKDLPRDVDRIVTYHDDLLNALMSDGTFGGLADTYDFIEWTFGPLAYGTQDTVGYKFIIRGIKIRSNIS